MAINDNGKQIGTDKEPIPQNRLPEDHDEWDLKSLRIGQNFPEGLGVRPAYLTISCRKPSDQEFFRVRDGEEWRLETGMFFDKNARNEAYLVHPDMWMELGKSVSVVCLFTAMTRGGEIFLWPIKLRQSDGSENEWFNSALGIARDATGRWVRMESDQKAGRYEAFYAVGDLPEPEWPADLSFQDLVKRCFQGRKISDHGHTLLRALRGEV